MQISRPVFRPCLYLVWFGASYEHRFPISKAITYFWTNISFWSSCTSLGIGAYEINLLVKVVIRETQIHMCVPRNVQMFIQSGALIAGQIETDFFSKHRMTLTFGHFPEKQENGFKFIQWIRQRGDFRTYFPIRMRVPWSWQMCALTLLLPLSSPRMLNERFSAGIRHEVGLWASSQSGMCLLVDLLFCPQI